MARTSTWDRPFGGIVTEKALSVRPEGGHVLRVHVQEAFRVHGKIGEEILHVDIDAPEPIHGRHLTHARHLFDARLIRGRHGKSHGDGVSGYQAVHRSVLHARVETVDYRSEEAEGKDGYGDAEDGEPAPEPVAKSVLEEESKKKHC